MAYTEVPADLELTKWQSEYWQEYVSMSGYKQYMSASINAIIMTNRDLIDGGKDIIVPLIGSLKGKGVGAGLLTGAEERLSSYPFRTRPVWRRNAVVTKKSMVQKAVIDILKANKDSLKIWSADDMQERIRDSLSVVAFDDARYNEDDGEQTGVPYAEANATQRNNWLTDNATRVMFGPFESNLVPGNMASSLANVDSTNDKWSAATVSAAKARARKRNRQLGQRAIRPYRVADGRKEWFVLFVPSDAFLALKNDVDIKAFNRESIAREMDSNPYFTGGDLVWDGVIIHEDPDLPSLGPVGASSANISAGYLCGAQALIVAWGQDPIATQRKDDDYGFIKGVGTEELRSIDKTFFKETGAVGPGTQHGIVTVFAAV